MGYAGANTWSALGQALLRMSDTSGQLYQQQQQKKLIDDDRKAATDRYNAELEYRKGRDQSTDAHQQAMQTIAANRANAELEMSGYSPGGLASVDRVSAPEITPRGPLFNEAQPVGSGLGAALMGSMPSLPKRAPQDIVSTQGGYDPSRDVELQRKIALEQSKPGEAPYNPSTDPAVLRAQYMQKTGLARNPNLPAPRQPGEPETPSSAITKLPTDVQRQITQIGPAYSSLDRFEQLSKDYLSSSPVKRGLSKLALGTPAKEAEIQAAQRGVLLSVKELANLGVLAGPDLEIVESLIGNPTNPRELFRDPQGTLNRIGQARKFLDDKVGSLEQNYGVQLRPQPDMNAAIRSYLQGIK